MCSTPRLGHYRLREEARATVGGRAMYAHAGKDLAPHNVPSHPARIRGQPRCEPVPSLLRESPTCMQVAQERESLQGRWAMRQAAGPQV